MGFALVWLINQLIGLFVFLIIANAIMSWLVAFNVVNPRNGFVYQVGRFLDGVTDPLLRPIRKVVPLLGGIDVSPIILILLLQFVQVLFNRSAAPIIIAYLG